MFQGSMKPREMRRFAAFASLGVEMVAPIAAGVGLDYWLDTSPWFTVAGVVLGFAGAFLHLFVLLKKFEDEDRSDPPPPPQGSP